MRNKNRETHAKEKQSHAQDSIYMVRQFAYVHGVEEISLLSGKKYATMFHTLKNDNNNKTPKEKQSHAQDSIYVVRQFAYVYRVAGISLL